MLLEKNTFLKVKDWAEFNFSKVNSIFSTKTHFWSLLYSAQNLAIKCNQICETKVLNGLYELISRKNNWSANSTYLYWKIISLHQLRIIIPKLAKRHSAPIYHRCPESWNLILQLWIVSNSHFLRRKRLLLSIFKTCLPFGLLSPSRK